jgi:hypothetical protein
MPEVCVEGACGLDWAREIGIGLVREPCDVHA